MFDYTLDYIFSYTATLDPPQWVGNCAEGLRMIFPVSGGEVTGPRVRGRILPGGGDWMNGRRDGVGVLDVRGTIETDDGALIYMAYSGVTDLGEDGYEKALRGELPASIKLRVAPRYQTAHSDYLWLNRLQCIAVGESSPAEMKVAYDVYALR
jgi:hypothetical protein